MNICAYIGLILCVGSSAWGAKPLAFPPPSEDLSLGTPIPDSYDAFISYRVAYSRHLAMLLKVLLKEVGINAFIDVDGLRGGDYQGQIFPVIKSAPNFIIIISDGTLDRCKGDFNASDILHQEMREALASGGRIIPVFDEFHFPSMRDYPEAIGKTLNNQGVKWQHPMTKPSLERLMKYLDLPKDHPMAIYSTME